MADTVAQPGTGVESFADRLHAHAPSHATQTIEMRQVTEINNQISSGARIVFADLGLDDLPTSVANTPLRHLHMEGSPTYPYMFGVFDLAAGGAHGAGVPLHTAHLQAISKALHLHHHWG